MCNKLHVDYTRIDPEGNAYKLVHHYTLLPEGSKWAGVSLGSGIYEVDMDGWIRWKDHKYIGKHPPFATLLGFCFIPTLKGALETHKSWKGMNTRIVEVMYKQGLGRFIEPEFIEGLKIDVMLAKEFKIIEGVVV